MWQNQRASKLQDGGAPHDDVYRCVDREFLTVGPLEPQFYRLFLQLIGLQGDALLQRRDERSLWPQLRERL